MCGIHASCLYKTSASGKPWKAAENYQELLARRGPDAVGSVEIHCGNSVRLLLSSSLLQLRGTERPPVPLTDSQGNVLLYNGEIFGGLEVAPGGSDGLALLTELGREGVNVVSVMNSLEGPWALCFWHAPAQTLWVARDALGRRSLLLRHHMYKGVLSGFCIASVADIPQQHADQADLGATSGAGDVAEPRSTSAASPVTDWQEIKPGVHSVCFDSSLQQVGPWVEHSWQSPRKARLREYERPPELVSPPPQLLPLVAKEADRQAMLQVLGALQASVQTRCCCIDRLPAQTPAECQSLMPAPVLVLFSGGVDSTLIAILAHRALPPGVPIDLASVCFDRGSSPDRIAAVDALQELQGAAPERQWRLIEVDASLADVTLHKAHLLHLLHPAQTLMDLNIGAALWLAARAEGCMRFPEGAAQHCTSDATFYWEGGKTYRSEARVVLVGHGADEQAAGYGRHRTRFRKDGWVGLQAELQIDVRRLWLRNLGRDDRILADHGREARHPFLDEAFMDTVLSLPLPLVADLKLEGGIGDKRLLRAILRELGLPRAAARVKRAIQFGSRLGKLSNIQHFGSNRGANARHAGAHNVSGDA